MSEQDDIQNDPFIGGSSLAKAVGNHAQPHKVFELAGRLKGTTFAVKWLPTSARMRAHADAVKVLTEEYGLDRADLYGEIGEGLMEVESMVQHLARAMVKPDSPGVAFAKSPAEIRDTFDPDEVQLLYDQWWDWQIARSPMIRAKSEAEARRIADDLGKGFRPTTSLKSCERSSLVLIASFLAETLVTRIKPSSSGSGQQNAPSDGSTETTQTEPKSQG